MGTFNDKLEYLNQTKENIRAVLIEQGQSVEESDTFRSYADKIRNIRSATEYTILEDVPIALDFSNGDQLISAGERTVVKTAIIQKPETLVPENIANGVNIAGIVGTLSGGSENGEATVYFVTFIGAEGTQLFKMPVLAGDDCKDPITHGDIEIPVKESTESQVFTYSGWSATENGEVDSNILSNVTEDKTVYALFYASARFYAITYYDVDGTTVLHSETLAYGTIPSYTPAKTGYTFMGWLPEVAEVTRDAEYSATWIEKLDFSSLTWTQIAEYCEKGESESFELGAKKIFSYKAGDSTYTGVAEIVGFNHDDLVDGSGKAGLTLRLNGFIGHTTDYYNATGSNSRCMIGWADCNLRKYQALRYTGNDENYTLSEDLLSVLKTVSKKYYSIANSAYEYVEDILFAPSTSELGFALPTGITDAYIADEGECYEAFTANKKPIFSGSSAYEELISVNNDGIAQSYWTRSRSSNYGTEYSWFVTDAGVLIRKEMTSKAYPIMFACI